MTLATYSDLQTAIGDWTGDTFTTAQKKDFIALAEAKFNRELRTLDMETRATATATGEYLILPDDFLELRAITCGDEPISYATPQHVRAIWATSETGTPRFYTVEDGQFKLAPIPATSPTIEVIYYKKIAALSDSNTANWLLTSHPDLYLFQSLAAAEVFGWNDSRASGMANAADNIISRLMAQEKKRRVGSAPLKMRTGIPYEPTGFGVGQRVVVRS